jgi:1,4-dihydroxy-2-naphthoate polyprenyltransferase
VNDYADGVRGTDTAERLGPPRAVAMGLIRPKAMKGAAIVVFVAVWIPGLYIVYRGGPVFLAVGVASILSGILYTSGPYPLAYHGFGDVFAFVFFGPIAVAGTYYVQVQSFDWLPVVAGVAPGLFSVAILTANNLRDIDGDRKADKRTLPARFGRRFAQCEYAAAVVLATLAVPALLVWHTAGHFYAAASGLTILLAWPAMRTVFTYRDPRALNGVLAKTGATLLVFALLFAVGWNV